MTQPPNLVADVLRIVADVLEGCRDRRDGYVYAQTAARELRAVADGLSAQTAAGAEPREVLLGPPPWKASLAVEVQGVEVTRRTLRRIVDAAWTAATESETVPSTEWADRIINGVLNPGPAQPGREPGGRTGDGQRAGVAHGNTAKEAPSGSFRFGPAESEPSPVTAVTGELRACPCPFCGAEMVRADWHKTLSALGVDV